MTLADTGGNGAIYLFTALGVETWSQLNEAFEGGPQVHGYSETIRNGINQVIYYGPAPAGLERGTLERSRPIQAPKRLKPCAIFPTSRDAYRLDSPG